MKISEKNIERIVKFNLDEEFYSDIMGIRGNIVSSFNEIVNDEDKNLYDYEDLNVDDYTNIDMIAIEDINNYNSMIKAIDDILDTEVDENILLASQGLKRMVIKLKTIDIKKFSKEICSLQIDCMDRNIIYANKSMTNSVLDIFMDGREDLYNIIKLMDIAINEKNRKLENKLFGKKKIKQEIDNIKIMKDNLLGAVNCTNDLIEIISEESDKFLSLANNLFFKLNKDNFNKILL